jgi:hypothetical protein
MQELSLDTILANWKPGSFDDPWTWGQEHEWLWCHQKKKMKDLTKSISTHGIKTPIILGDDGRVWDGHHRICIAIDLKIETLKITYGTE